MNNSIKKKIGILTFHHAINEGAVLQAYSLVQNLKKLLPHAQVEIIDYRSLAAELRYLRYAFITKHINSLPNKISHYFRVKSFIEKELPLSKEKMVSDNYLRAVKFIQSQNYDGIVVGSDEVWKFGSLCLGRLFPNIYWLGNGLKCKKVAFAVSANRADYKKLRLGQINFMLNSLKAFDHITVRDKHTFDMIKFLDLHDQKNISFAPDPSFMLDLPQIELKGKLSSFGISYDKPRVAIMVNEGGLNRELVKYFKKRRYQTLAISCFIKEADINLFGKLDVFEWASIIKYVSFCVTDRFHPTIFSLRHNTPFLTIDYEARYQEYDSKTSFLLRIMGLEKNYIKATTQTWDKVKKSLEHLLEHNRKENFLEKFNEQRKIALDCLMREAQLLVS